ncbi:hypothetical protein [Actinoplanes sp. URMC 104]|uniref:hypothetical protein n=1 Tax=Actinoplanes sp. URMC 104 TaxID=3423409 RepID=UPI003F19BDE9
MGRRIRLGPASGVEGDHSYGAVLTRHLLSSGIGVIEVNQPDKAHQRRRGKTDAIDADLVRAIPTLSGSHLPLEIHTGIERAVRYEATLAIASINQWLRALRNTA